MLAVARWIARREQNKEERGGQTEQSFTIFLYSNFFSFIFKSGILVDFEDDEEKGHTDDARGRPNLDSSASSFGIQNITKFVQKSRIVLKVFLFVVLISSRTVLTFCIVRTGGEVTRPVCTGQTDCCVEGPQRKPVWAILRSYYCKLRHQSHNEGLFNVHKIDSLVKTKYLIFENKNKIIINCRNWASRQKVLWIKWK